MKLTAEDQSKLRDKELANIIRKLNGGKTLTAREEAKLAAASAGGQIDATGYVGTWDELGQRLGVSRRAIQDWRNDPRYAAELKARAPLLARADGRHCVAEWLRLMVDLQLKRGAASADVEIDPENAGDDEGEGIIKPPPVGGSQAQWKVAISALEHRKRETEIETLEGTLLVAAELEVPLGAFMATVQTKLAQFPQRVAGHVRGLRDVAEVEARLRDEIDADLLDLQSAHYTVEDAVARTVAAVPFDAESERLFTAVCFDGQDRTQLMQLISAVATHALRLIGRRAVRSLAMESPAADSRNPAEPTDAGEPPSAILPPVASGSATTVSAHGESPPSAAPKASGKISRSRKSPVVEKKAARKARAKTTAAPAEIEAAIAPARKKRR